MLTMFLAPLQGIVLRFFHRTLARGWQAVAGLLRGVSVGRCVRWGEGFGSDFLERRCDQ